MPAPVSNPPMSNSPASYTATAKWLHWIMAVLIIGLWIVGISLDQIPKGEMRGTIIGLHKAFGATILALVVLRLAWRATHPAPALPDTMPPLEKLGAKLGHVALYGLMIALPLDGILMSQAGGRPVDVFGLILPTLVEKNDALRAIFGQGHTVIAWILALTLLAHVAAALRHHLFLKDDVLTRMLPNRR